MYQILVAEDKPVERVALRKLLERNLGEGCTVLEANNGREAVACYAQNQPQLLLLGIELSDFSGLEAARQIRAQGGTCAIVFLSAYANFHYAQEAISLRARDYLLKPYQEKDLLRAVEACMSDGVLRVQPEPEPEQDEEPARLVYIRARIEEYIRRNYHTNLSLQRVAQEMNYSDTHFCRLFKRCFKVNFSVYLTQYRVERAKELLDNTMDTVKEVGTACGYTDTSYFIRIFKRITGTTPSEYRIAQTENNKKVP